jgi:hypothetical protein
VIWSWIEEGHQGAASRRSIEEQNRETTRLPSTSAWTPLALLSGRLLQRLENGIHKSKHFQANHCIDTQFGQPKIRLDPQD